MTSMPPISSLSAQAVAIPFIPANNQELSDAITRLAGHINAAQYRFLKLLAALIERNAWSGDSGLKSPAHWLNYYCGIDLGAAREKVRVAKALAALPLIDASFRGGAISYSKVRAMTRCATPDNEAHLLQVAQHGTAQHVEKLVRKYARAKRLSDPQQDKGQYAAREFSWYHDDDGMVILSGRLPAAEGAAFLQAMEVMFQVIGPQAQAKAPEGQRTAGTENTFPQQGVCGDEGESAAAAEAVQPPIAEDVSAETSFAETAAPTFAQKRADALVAMADMALNSQVAGGKPLAAADKYQVMIHIDAAQVGNPSAETCKDARSSLDSGACHFPLAAATARRLACDASLVTVLEDADGNVLNVGRKTRVIPPAIRRALSLRDRGCRFPGCCESRFVDAHHIHHWCDGGETRLDNLVLLCRRHHRLLHQDGYEIVKDNANNFEFVRPDGTAMASALSPQFTATDDDLSKAPSVETEDLDLGLDIDARTAVTAWQGERMDYSFAVGTLLDIRDGSRERLGVS